MGRSPYTDKGNGTVERPAPLRKLGQVPCLTSSIHICCTTRSQDLISYESCHVSHDFNAINLSDNPLLIVLIESVDPSFLNNRHHF